MPVLLSSLSHVHTMCERTPVPGWHFHKFGVLCATARGESSMRKGERSIPKVLVFLCLSRGELALRPARRAAGGLGTTRSSMRARWWRAGCTLRQCTYWCTSMLASACSERVCVSADLSVCVFWRCSWCI